MAVSFPIQIMVLYGHGPFEWAEIAAKLTPLNWMVIMAAVASAWLTLKASPALFVMIPGLATLVAYNNWCVAHADLNYSPAAAAVATAAFFLGMLPIFTPQAREVLLNPSLRWWLTPERHRAELRVRMKVVWHGPRPAQGRDPRNREIYARTYDLSEGGAFIPFDQLTSGFLNVADRAAPLGRKLTLFDVPVGAQCYVCLPLRGYNWLQCRAEVVRAVGPRGQYPSGIGIRFLGLSREDRRQLQVFLKDYRPTPAAAAPAMAQHAA